MTSSAATAAPRPATDRDAPLTIPSRLASPTAKLVYLYLDTRSGATARELRAALDVELLSLLPVLRTLVERDLLVRDGAHYRCPTPAVD